MNTTTLDNQMIVDTLAELAEGGDYAAQSELNGLRNIARGGDRLLLSDNLNRAGVWLEETERV